MEGYYSERHKSAFQDTKHEFFRASNADAVYEKWSRETIAEG